MNRARQELLELVRSAESFAETAEREASRLRWNAEAECEVLFCRARLGRLKKESER